MNTLEKISEFSLSGVYSLPKLPYSYENLEPYIDTRTMEIHHTKHHQTYIDNLNKALENDDNKNLPLLKLFSKISTMPAAIRNNGGGHFNHTLFWTIMRPGRENNRPSGQIATAIDYQLGGFEKLVELFSQAALTRFGSGWAWLSVDENNKLFISSTPNQDNPLMDVAEQRGYPILGIDVWEHAYYLKYQNRRAEYVQNFFNIINWEEVNKRYLAIIE